MLPTPDFLTATTAVLNPHDIQLLQYCHHDKRVITLVLEMGGSIQSLKGQLLLDGGMLTGSFFHRTVVFVCQHNEEGAFGLILNRRMEHTIQELSTEVIPEKLEQTPIHVGGPVQPGALSFLITDSYLDEGEIIPNVAMGHSFDRLVALCNHYSPQRDIRIFSGYSGWSPGQLDAEIKRGSWKTHPASKKLVFDHDPEDLWRHVMYQIGWEERLLADSPDDLSSN
jgi:putative transcriptional regulator